MPDLVVSRWYMVDSFAVRRMVNSSWVKNVNNLRTIGSISSVDSSTAKLLTLITGIITCSKVILNKLNLLYFYTMLYTHILEQITLLNKSFTYFPQSLLMRLLKEN